MTFLTVNQQRLSFIIANLNENIRKTISTVNVLCNVTELMLHSCKVFSSFQLMLMCFFKKKKMLPWTGIVTDDVSSVLTWLYPNKTPAKNSSKSQITLSLRSNVSTEVFSGHMVSWLLSNDFTKALLFKMQVFVYTTKGGEFFSNGHCIKGLT